MIALTLALIVSQIPPAAPEVFERYEAAQRPVLKALSAKYKCQKPRKAPEPMCEVALSERSGTAADIQGQNAMVGLSWLIKRGKGGRVEVSTPVLSALALNQDGDEFWGAVTNITPQDDAEKKQLTQLTKDYEALLRGKKSKVTPPDGVKGLLAVWSKTANHPLEKKDNAWTFQGAPGALRKVGERWVLMGAPRSGGELAVSVFVP
jgi:hypothetical protein